MRKYYIDDCITYCYPYETRNRTEEYGVLKEYIGKTFNRDEIDKIICELITRHPYIENAMSLNIRILWTEGYIGGFYHTFEFSNDNSEKQKRGSLEIKYEK